MPGMGELVVILLIVLVVFGANKLPGIGDALGKSIRNFKKASAGDQDAAHQGGSITVDPPKKVAAGVKSAQLDAGDGDDEDEEWEEVVVRRKKKKAEAS
ncbi:MAG TPA: twin-arginine translocase TatA/TatE family subunit [Polyangiales bacterium]|jgi:sec-independent protein translocase protein TatA|nr:twin-arginine translocase TatA/TatE family subunit [Polyangiales bacterium]